MFNVHTEYINMVDKYRVPLYRLMYGYVKNQEDAEDVVQVAYLKLWETTKDFESEVHAKNWLYTVAVNYGKDLLKSSWHRHRSITEDIVFVEKEQFDLSNAISSLPDKYRIVVLLFYYEDYSVKEISNILSRNESTIQTHLQRARNMLKKKLKEEWDYEE